MFCLIFFCLFNCLLLFAREKEHKVRYVGRWEESRICFSFCWSGTVRAFMKSTPHYLLSELEISVVVAHFSPVGSKCLELCEKVVSGVLVQGLLGINTKVKCICPASFSVSSLATLRSSEARLPRQREEVMGKIRTVFSSLTLLAIASNPKRCYLLDHQYPHCKERLTLLRRTLGR